MPSPFAESSQPFNPLADQPSGAPQAPAAHPASAPLPGTTPSVGSAPYEQNQNPNSPAPQQPAGSDNSTVLANFDKLWDTDENDKDAVDPLKFSVLESSKATEIAEGFAPKLDEAEVAKAMESGDSKALAALFNKALASSVASSLEGSSRMGSAYASQGATAGTSLAMKEVRRDDATTRLVTSLPQLGSKAMKGSVAATIAQYQKKYPDASPTKIAKEVGIFYQDQLGIKEAEVKATKSTKREAKPDWLDFAS
jgi:hypothetical protein